ncbi:MAG: acyl-CoA desaturase [Flammeovirgaceae bacterium]
MIPSEKKLRFLDKNQSKFFQTVRKRVDDYFKSNHLSKNANGQMYFKTFLFLGGTFFLYGLIMSGMFNLWQMWVLAILLGTFKAFIGFNVAHDAIHGSYFKNQTLNKWLGRISFNFIGGNDYMWSITHNLVHHTYTNIPGHDEDIDVAPGLLRISPEEPWKPFMRFQQWYAFLLYGLAYISWVMRKDYKKFFQDKIGQTKLHHKPSDYFNLFFFKVVYYVLFIVLPLIFLPVTWWQFLIGFVSMQLAGGLVLGLVFQLAHVVEGTDFPYPNSEGNIEEAWAVHQMYTTANFARKSWISTFLCGGLNYQIEHHLFPNICHIHYPKISEIVKSTAEEFGLPYIEHPTFLAATQSHFRTLKKFGQNPN